jgi:hydrogenase-4 component B
MNIFTSAIILWLPLILIFYGLFEAIVEPLIDHRHRYFRRFSVTFYFLISTILIMLTFESIIESPIVYSFDQIFGMGISFKIDLINYILMVFASIMFTVTSLFSFDELRNQLHEKSFYFFMVITYVATMGTLMANDLLAFFLFFEIMTFTTYGMIVHYRDEALAAGKMYITMGIVGGLSILSGIVLLYAYTGSIEWVQLADKFSQLGMVKYLIAGLFIIGFGIKAGLVPFHFWLPKVYKVAPFSLNALSSGILTKVAAYGILRVAAIVFSVNPNSLSLSDVNLWLTSANIGRVLIWLGILTMVVGVFLALIQEDVKKMLAYHSVSQMGYIVLGIGVAAYLGYKGAMGLSGSLYHMINHGLFKALLFMSAGAVFFYTKETNMYRLGGLWKKMPVVALLALIGVFGITGMPGFNGFASKSILHHAIIEAYEYGDSSFRYAEWLFTLVSAGTVSSFMKFYSYIFLGKLKDQHKDIKPKNKWMIRAMVILAVMIVFIGIFPSWLMDGFLIRALQSFSYDPSFINKYIVGMNFFNIKDLQNMALVYVLGAAIFYIGVKFHLFHAHLPNWMNAEKWLYIPADKFCEQFPDFCVIRYERPMIRGDVFIYVILLTLLLGGFIASLLF